MCSREFSTASCWNSLIFAGSVRLKTPPTGFSASAVLICPSLSSVSWLSFSCSVIFCRSALTFDSTLWLAWARVFFNDRSSFDLLPAVTTPTPTAHNSTSSTAIADARRPARPIEASLGVETAKRLSPVGHVTKRTRFAAKPIGYLAAAMRARFAAAFVAILLFPAGASADALPLTQVAQRTWDSMAAMVDTDSGLPADVLNANGSTSVQTSTTNIGAYMWSAVAAQRLGFISQQELTARLTRTIGTLERMERYGDTGQFYNWYDHRDGSKLTYWPPSPSDVFHPILSSVDNGWLAVGLRIVQNSVPALSQRAGALYDAMNFGFYYRPDVNRVLFHYRPDDPAASPCCYDTVVSESRIVDYIGIARGQLPDKEYYGRWRSFPDTCDWSWQETRPIGEWRTYFGVPVFEGAYPYDGTLVTPSWGGSMFEALMPDLFVPEEQWAPNSWGVNHPVTVQAQIHHGMVDAGYGVWGFSPSNTPEGGYGGYGVDAIGMDPNGSTSNEDHTTVDHGWGGPGRGPPPPPRPAPPPH